MGTGRGTKIALKVGTGQKYGRVVMVRVGLGLWLGLVQNKVMLKVR